jgi:hypothetical protein
MNENEMKKCENYYPAQCENIATVWHYDCCGGYYGIDLCVDCANEWYLNGDTDMCEWYNTIDDVVVASSNPDEVGVSYK